MTSERDVRQAMIDQLGAGTLPWDDLLDAIATQPELGSPKAVERIAERLRMRDTAFTEIGDDVAYIPALLDGTSWTIRVDPDDAAQGFVRVHPALAPLGWWLIESGAELVDDTGDTVGRVTTDGVWIDDVDTDVVLGPPGWLDAVAGGWATVTVESERLQLTPCDEPPTPTPRQVDAMRAGFERTATRDDAVLFDGRHAELTHATGDEAALAALVADREAFVEAPIAFLPDLYAAAGLEERDSTLAEAGFDWAALDERIQRNRVQTFYGLDEGQTDALVLLTGTCHLHTEKAEAAYGDTDAERDGAAVLMAALLEDGDVAEAVWSETLQWGPAPHQIEAFADALAARTTHIAPVELGGLAWLRSRCMEMRGAVREAVELVEEVTSAGSEHPPLLLEAAAAASDRGDAPGAMRLIRRAGVSEHDLHDPELDPSIDLGVGLLSEVLPFSLQRPKPQAGRNDPCPCGSGRKYKACHLGTERHELSDRSAWLYDKAARYVRRTAPTQLAYLATTLAEGSFSVGRELASSPFLIDVTLHERGVLAEFLDDRGWLLPDDEQMLASQWSHVDRGVFEILQVRGDELRLRNIGRGETITVVNTHESDATRPGMTLIGRPLPVGDTYRAFGGFLPAPPHLVNDLIDAIDADDVETLLALLASMFRPPELRNTAGEVMSFHTIRWAVDDAAQLHDALTSAGFTGGDGEWGLSEDTSGMREAIVAMLRFDADSGVLSAEVNSDERAATVRRLVDEALPAARFLDDERRDLDELRDHLDDLGEFDDADGGDPDGMLDPDDPEVRQFLDELIRSKEVEWIDEQIPALGGRTPREAVADPVGREEVRQLLASWPEPPPGEVGGFRASRIRTLLDLDE